MGKILQPFNNLLSPGPRQVPVGKVDIDWTHQLARGLVYFRLFNDYKHPIYTSLNSESFASIYNNSLIGMSDMGLAFVGTANTSYFGTGSANTNKVVIPTTGSIVAFLRASFISNDSLSHYVFQCGDGAVYKRSPNIDMVKFSNNNFYAGWWTPSGDFRGITSVVGLWAVGETFAIGLSYTNGGATQTYIKGVQTYNAGTISTGDTSTGTVSDFNIGGGAGEGATTAGWCQASGDAIYYLGIWDRVLTADEMAWLNQEPYSFLLSAEYDLPVIAVLSAAHLDRMFLVM